ncbi:MAG: hypothetical protein IPL43_08165 [Micropruina sp.]|nr:hypothetical protein [Micropruina sp.]
MAEGSTGQTELRKSLLEALSIRVPPHAVQRRVGQLLGDLAALEERKLAENVELAAARDALLPLLMSGRVRVREAEKSIEGVV